MLFYFYNNEPLAKMYLSVCKYTTKCILYKYLEDKHFSSEDGYRVKVALADIGAKAWDPRSVCGPWCVIGRVGCHRGRGARTRS